MSKREGGAQHPTEKPAQKRDSKGRFSYGPKQGTAGEDHHEADHDGKPPQVDGDEGDMKH